MLKAEMIARTLHAGRFDGDLEVCRHVAERELRRAAGSDVAYEAWNTAVPPGFAQRYIAAHSQSYIGKFNAQAALTDLP